MPEIRIAYELPLFEYAVIWSGTEAEAAAVLDSQLAAIAEQGLDSVVALATGVAQAPAILQAGLDAATVRGLHVLLTAWALQQNAGHPDFPGRVIDYLPTYDFDVTIAATESGEITATIEA